MASPALLVNTTEPVAGACALHVRGTDNANEAEEFKFLPIASDNDVPLSTAASLKRAFLVDARGLFPRGGRTDHEGPSGRRRLFRQFRCDRAGR